MYELLMRPFVRLQIAVVELREREDGQTTTEYAILLGFLAIAIIIALFFLRNVLRSLFSNAASSVSNAPAAERPTKSHGGPPRRAVRVRPRHTPVVRPRCRLEPKREL